MNIWCIIKSHVKQLQLRVILMSASEILKIIKDKEIEYVDLRFTDPRGKLQL